MSRLNNNVKVEQIKDGVRKISGDFKVPFHKLSKNDRQKLFNTIRES